MPSLQTMFKTYKYIKFGIATSILINNTLQGENKVNFKSTTAPNQ